MPDVPLSLCHAPFNGESPVANLSIAVAIVFVKANGFQ
jgi:hypothetical protein